MLQERKDRSPATEKFFVQRDQSANFNEIVSLLEELFFAARLTLRGTRQIGFASYAAHPRGHRGRSTAAVQSIRG
jgi:hypothetical protein